MFEKINNTGTEAGQKEEFSELKKEAKGRNRNRKFLDKVLGRGKVHPHNIAHEKYYDEAKKENEEFGEKRLETEINEGIVTETPNVETIKKDNGDIDQPIREKAVEEKELKLERKIENIDRIKENLILLEKYAPFLESVVSSVRGLEDALGNPELFGVLGLAETPRKLSALAGQYDKLSKELDAGLSQDDKELEKTLLSIPEKDLNTIANLERIIEIDHTGIFASVLMADGVVRSPLMPELDRENVLGKNMNFQNKSDISGSLSDTARVIRDFFSRNLGIDFHDIVPLETKFDKHKHTDPKDSWGIMPETKYKQSSEASKKLLSFIYDLYKKHENKQEGLVVAVTTLGYDKNKDVCLRSRVYSIDMDGLNYLLNYHIGMRD